MRGHSEQEYINWYSEQVNCKLAVSLNGEGEVTARALLWKCEDEEKVMDRIYGNDASIVAFKAWAKNNGYAHKVEQSYSSDTFLLSDGSECNNERKISLCSERSNDFPFMDTFKFYDGWRGLSTEQCNTYNFELDSISGEGMCSTCDNCGGSINEDEECNSDNGDTHCHDCVVYSERENDYILCGNCEWVERAQSYVLSEECAYSEHYGEMLLTDEAFYVNGDWYPADDCTEVSGEIVLNEESTYCEQSQEDVLICECHIVEYDYVHEDFLREIDGEWHLVDDCTEIDGEWHLVDDCTEIDGEWHLVDDIINYHGEWKLTENIEGIQA